MSFSERVWPRLGYNSSRWILIIPSSLPHQDSKSRSEASNEPSEGHIPWLSENREEDVGYCHSTRLRHRRIPPKRKGGVLDAVHQENLIINPVKSYFDPESPISSPVPTHQECSTRINHSDHQIRLLWSMCEFKLFFSKFRTSRSQPKSRSKICLRRNYGQPKKSSWCL